MAPVVPLKLSIFAVIILVCTLFLSTSAITITSGPLNTEAIEGETVELLCTVSDKGDTSIHWLHDDQQLSYDYELYPEVSNSRYSIIDNGNRNVDFTLRIINVRWSDAGRYRCGYYQPTPTFQDAILSVYARGDLQQQVNRPPNEGFPRCTVSPSAAQLDQTVALTCASEGGIPPARLMWLRDGMSITGESQLINRVDRTMRPEDNGVEFTCRLNHQERNTPLVCSVVPLSILPEVRIEPEVVTAEEGQGALFTCVANGIVGSVRYTFFFRDEDVSRNPQRFVVSQDFRQLTILNVRVSDHNAAIRCKVSINGLSVSSSAVLRINGVMDNVTTPFMPPMNATTPATPPQRPFGLSQETFLIIIIVVGIVVGQLLCAIVIFILHRCLTGRHDAAMSMEWKGMNKSIRDPHEIVPALANWTAKRRYTELSPGEVSHSRYQDLVTSSVVGESAQAVDSMEMGVYEGVAGRPLSGAGVIVSEFSAPRTPSPRLAQQVAAGRTRAPSPKSPKHPPPRVTSGSGLPIGSSSPKPSTNAPRYPPQRIPAGTPRMPPSIGLYKRPTSNALSSTAEDTLSYQDCVIAQGKGVGEALYDETPDIYSEPAKEGDFIYEVPPDSDGYIQPNPQSIEDPDLDDYELPPTEVEQRYVQM